MKAFGSLLPRFALRRPVTVSMVLLASLVMGVISWSRIPVQLMPSGYDFPYIWVWMPYKASTPRETERQIVQPVEDAIETLPGVRRLEARASRNFARFEIELNQGTDMDEAYNGLVERLERTRVELPDDFEQYYVYKYNPSDQPIVWAAVTLPSDAEDPAYVIETRIQGALERVPGVARVEFNGAHRARVYIDFSREALESHKVSLYEVMQSLQSDNFTMPSGDLQADGRVVLLRSIASFESAREIARLPIREGLVLEDVAEVVLARPVSGSIHRVNGETAASMDIYKESGANTIEVCEGVRAAIDRLGSDPRLRDYAVHPFFDQGALIQESVDTLRNAALQGGVLAIFVLLLFLRRLKVTVLIALSIPLSLLMTVVIQYALGESINLLAMMGLMLSVGMTVDNSVVVVESIYRRRELGDSPREAAVLGTAEVALAILAATLTTVVVFLPLILMSDDAEFSFFMGRLGLPVCFALACSLVVALVFVPLVTLATGPPAAPSALARSMTGAYVRLLSLVLRKRSSAFALTLLLLFSISIPMNHLKESDSTEGGIIDFVIGMEFPATFTTAEIDDALRSYEEEVEEKRQEWGIRAIRVRRWEGSRRGFLMAFMDKRERGSLTKEEITEALPDLLEEVDIPGVQTWVGWRRNSDDENKLTVRLTGDDSDRLVVLGDEVVRRLRDLPGVLGVEADIDERGTDELHVDVHREKAARYGVSPDILARSVAFGFRGMSLRPALIDGREVPVQAGFRLEDRADVRRLEDFGVWSPVGGQVALGTVAALSFHRGHGTIRRQDRKTSLSVSVTLEEEDVAAGYALIRQGLSSLELPRGYSWSPGRRWDRLKEQDRARKFALLMSVSFVFLLMGMLFESVWTPLSVLFSIPFAFVGVYWMLFLTGTTFEMMAGIGLVILVGIVVNNAIVLVDRVQQHRQAGLDRDEALLCAGRDRFRPILMTAATTIVGLLPMALGESGLIGIPYFPLGRAVIGGLIVSTALSLLLVPLFYTYLDDLRSLLGGVFRAPPLAGAQARISEEA
ncbi:MAG: efflux RND transporter permease subunit [Myxococcota bacterium]|nr:efflux RND transporter permease subunit [Myxococcota bacterium]